MNNKSKTMKLIIAAILASTLVCGAEFEMEIVVNGKPVKEFSHAGKSFVEGLPDSAFTIKLKNNTAQRALFVPSVDGLSAIDGQPAKEEGGGYVVGPGSSYEIVGWRTSLEEARKFVFAEKKSGQTYTEKTGHGTENCGTVSVKVFKEKTHWTPFLNTITVPCDSSVNWNTTTSTLSVNTSGNMNVSAVSSTGFDLGTKMGTTQQSIVKEVEFEKSKESTELTVYYASLSGLVSLGVDVYPKAFAQVFCKPVE